tara:strand:- start:440 stop:1567 length:1128 start_codon:yes stop_codon:yes gene_type:complete
MGLLGTTNAENYYTSSQKFTTSTSQASSGDYVLTVSNLPADEDAFIVFVNGTEVGRDKYTFPKTNTNNTINFTSNLPVAGDTVLVKFTDRKLGDYRYINLVDIINNFMYGYTGDGKVINKAKRSDILFHAKRGIQEFAYDISRVEKIQEVEVGPDLTVAMPQDYVNYIMLSWVDTSGLEHPIFPAEYTSRPSESIAQDANGDYLFTSQGDTVTVTPSITQTRFKDFDLNLYSGNLANDDYYLFTHYVSNRIYNRSGRYGIDPVKANFNGVFVVDEVNGQFGFSNDLSGRIINIKYVSDGLATDSEMKIHKLAEDAIYKYIYHAVLSTKLGVPEYQVMRAKRDRRAAMRNAKLRLSDLNIKELTNIMKGKAKHIKH